MSKLHTTNSRCSLRHSMYFAQAELVELPGWQITMRAVEHQCYEIRVYPGVRFASALAHLCLMLEKGRPGYSTWSFRVDEQVRRHGIATLMYDFARANGLTVRRPLESDFCGHGSLTGDGKAFWDAYERSIA